MRQRAFLAQQGVAQEQVVEVAALDVFHRDPAVQAVFAELVDGDDARMAQAPDDARLVAEAQQDSVGVAIVVGAVALAAS